MGRDQIAAVDGCGHSGAHLQYYKANQLGEVQLASSAFGQAMAITPLQMCTGGVNAKNVNDYLGYDQLFAVGGTWMCKSDVIKACLLYTSRCV